MSELKKHVAVLCTYNRVTLLGRSIRCWLMQEYENKELCIFNNSPIDITLNIEHPNIHIINQSKSIFGNDNYSCQGEMYNNALIQFNDKIVYSDIVTMWQDDDIYLCNFLDACNTFNGLIYKSYHAYYFEKDKEVLNIVNNNLEGSWLISSDFLLTTGFSNTPHAESKLLARAKDNNLYIEDVNLPLSYVYEWYNDVYHMSQDLYGKDSIVTYRNNNTDSASVVKVWSEEEVLSQLKSYKIQ